MIDVSSPNLPQDEPFTKRLFKNLTYFDFYFVREVSIALSDELWLKEEVLKLLQPLIRPFSAAQKHCLLESGIRYVVCVRQEVEAHFIKPQISDPSFAYLTLDIADNATENIIRFFPKVRQFIDEALSNNCKVLVHGNNGNSRSATLILAYIMEKFGLSYSDALRKKRASINPNEGFQAQLAEYEPIYKARQTLANGESSSDRRPKRKCEQLTETVDYNLIQRPPSPDLENNYQEYSQSDRIF
ncbi:hypothetical protein NQ317_014588 [Molorchus minor]|uniref:Uncharacterized protein n=1 Tax=Molorchus minor TaxID=1323400 RepID=A0ABQ9K1J6_9CUCU|nr:hypothetical protein NQ317_014588 [Molorchus minor]